MIKSFFLLFSLLFSQATFAESDSCSGGYRDAEFFSAYYIDNEDYTGYECWYSCMRCQDKALDSDWIRYHREIACPLSCGAGGDNCVGIVRTNFPKCKNQALYPQEGVPGGGCRSACTLQAICECSNVTGQ